MSARKPLSVKNSDHTRKPLGGGVKGKKKDRYPFPILDIPSLVASLNGILRDAAGFGPMTLTGDDLKNISTEKVQMIYFRLLNFCIGVSMESLKLPSFQQTCVSDFPEMTEEFMYKIQFFRLMKRLMNTCLVPDFKMEDLLNPDPKRTCRNLSAIVNYIKFHYSVFMMDDPTTSINQTRDALAEEYSKLLEKNKKLKIDFSALKKQRQEEHELEEKLKAEIDAQDEAMRKLITREDFLKQQYETLCEEKEKSSQHLAGLTREQEKCSLRIDDLMKQVVTSPDKLKAKLGHLQEQVQVAITTSKETENLLRMWESLASQAHQIAEHGAIKMLNEDLDALILKVEKRNGLSAKLEALEEQVRSENQLLREATARHQSLLQNLKLMNIECERVTYQDRKITHSHLSKDLEKDVLLLQQEIRQKDLKEEWCRQQTEEMEERLDEHREEVKKAQGEMNELASGLLTAFHDKADQYKAIIKTLGINF